MNFGSFLMMSIVLILLFTLLVHRERIMVDFARMAGYRKGYDAGAKTAARNIHDRVNREMKRMYGKTHLVPGVEGR